MSTKTFFAATASAVVMMLASAAPAAAATLYDVSYTTPANGDHGNFLLALGTAAGGGFFNVATISGAWDGNAITGLVPVNGYAGNDNLFSPTPSPNYFTFPGVSFSTVGGIDINIANNGTAVYTEDRSDSDPGGGPQFPINLSVTALPEPGAWALMLVGLFGLGAVLRRSRRNPAGALASA